MRYLYALLLAGALLALWGRLGPAFADAAALAVVVGAPLLVALRKPRA